MGKRPGIGKQVEAILLRQADTRTPEQKLFVAVISQAAGDWLTGRAGVAAKQDGHNFIFSWRLNPFATAIGLEPEFVREVCVKAKAAQQNARRLALAA